MSLFSPVTDLLAYLLSIQILLQVGFYYQSDKADGLSVLSWSAVLSACGLIGVFWIVWGGYGVDSWRYLLTADGNPFILYPDRFFWVSLHYLGRVLEDPWPLKVISAVAALTTCAAYRLWYGKSRDFILAIILLMAVPGFLLLFGNAVRQGLAGSFIVLGTVLWMSGRHRLAVIVALVAVLSHTFALLALIAVLILRYTGRYILCFWALSFFVSPLAIFISSQIGFDLGSVVRYADYTEGHFHLTKVGVSAIAGGVVAWTILKEGGSGYDFRHVYLSLLTLSNCVAYFEVPFERLLLFSDLVAPLAVITILTGRTGLRRLYAPSALLASCAGILVWSSISVMTSLGYA